MKTPSSHHAALFSIKGVAEYPHLSVKTDRRPIDRGDMTALKVGSQWRIHPNDLNDFVFVRRQAGRQTMSIVCPYFSVR